MDLNATYLLMNAKHRLCPGRVEIKPLQTDYFGLHAAK